MNLVYRYGLRPPMENAELVRQQMRAAHDYRNTLVEIERGRRAARRVLDHEHPDVATIETEAAKAEATVITAKRAVAAVKSDSRSRVVPQELRDALVDARVARRDVMQKLKAARKEAKVENKDKATSIDTLAADLRRSARSLTDAYWGTYLLVEASDEQAREAPLYDGTEPNDPRFVRWSGEGSVGVQLQGGENAVDIVDSTDTRLRVEMVPDRFGRDLPDRKFANLWMRVGSNGRAPVWAKWPMLVHRPMPDGARIKRAVVTLRKIGPREEWSVQITIATPETSRASRGGVVAVDLGWRQLDDGGIRVARWRSDGGEDGEIAIGAKLVSKMRHPEELASIRSKAFNVAREKLVAWLAIAPDMPEWLRTATSHLTQWRSAGRLASLALRWRAQRFEGDAEGYDALERWRYHDHHLWTWETSERKKAVRSRTDLFRVAASQLSARFDVIVLEGSDDRGEKAMDLSQMARRPAVDSEAPQIDCAMSNRMLAAPGEFRDALVNAFRGTVADEAGTRKRIAFKIAWNTTRKCNACGAIEEWDQANEVQHCCSKCQATWDQDDNAAANLLADYQRTPDDGPDSGVSRKDDKAPEEGAPKESKWARAKRMKAEKTAAAEPPRADGAVAAAE
ncbi:MAG: hypothetical protein ACHREM_06580 [Polyangiales bacterium]